MRIPRSSVRGRAGHFAVHAVLAAATVAALLPAGTGLAQYVTLPPSGGNQKASVSQWIGPVELNLTYNSPKVIAPDGTDRRGKIWGELVPWGMGKEIYGTCGDQCPWRAGANENTVFRASHAVKVEGKPLPAGSYGVHMLPGKEEWTVIFSKDASSWGSFFYDARNDALRVTVKPRKAPYTHWLTYEFVERTPENATFVLRWDELEVPVSVAVEDATDLWVARVRDELHGARGGSADAWEQGASFCLRRKVNLPEALKWAQYAVTATYVGRKDFGTLSTLADAQEANGLAAEAKKTRGQALEQPTAGAVEVHMYGRSLLAQGKKEEALAVFELNAKRHPGAWPVNVGLARGYAAVGRNADALKAAKLAVAEAPDEANRKNLQKLVQALEAGKPLD